MENPKKSGSEPKTTLLLTGSVFYQSKCHTLKRALSFLGLLLFSASSLAVLAGDGTAQTIAKPDDPLEGYAIVRCLFREGRLVVRREGKMTILRQGDRLPDSSLVVTSITNTQAVLEAGKEVRRSGDKAVLVPMTMVIITEGPGGRPEMKVFRSSPPADEAAPPMAGSSSLAQVHGEASPSDSSRSDTKNAVQEPLKK